MTTFKLGKLPAQDDSRSIPFKKLLRLEKLPSIPETFDVQESVGVHDDFVFGNDRWGDCVIAAHAHHTLGLEKLEQGEQIPITDQEVIEQYLYETGGDDVGLIMLNSLKEWRNYGWEVGGKTYRIHAFAMVDWLDHEEARQAAYLLNGVQIGLQIPQYVMGVFDFKLFWDIEEENTNIIGGHAVFGKGISKYLKASVRTITGIGPVVKTWGKDVQMTWRFWDRYVDECWAIVDEIDQWLGVDSPLDINLMNSYLEEITGEGPFPPGPPEADFVVNIKGSGTVTLDPGGIHLTSGQPIRIRIGKTIKLTAAPNSGYEFMGWGSDSLHIDDLGVDPEIIAVQWFTGQASVWATFEPTSPEPPEPPEPTPVSTHTLSISIVGPGSVEVSTPGATTIKVLREFSIDRKEGTIADLLAIPDEGALFVAFTGDFFPITSKSIQVTMDKDQSITANFIYLRVPFWQRIWRWIKEFFGRYL